MKFAKNVLKKVILKNSQFVFPETLPSYIFFVGFLNLGLYSCSSSCPDCRQFESYLNMKTTDSTITYEVSEVRGVEISIADSINLLSELIEEKANFILQEKLQIAKKKKRQF